MGIVKSFSKKLKAKKITGTPVITWGKDKLFQYLSERLPARVLRPSRDRWDSDEIETSLDRVEELVAEQCRSFSVEGLGYCCAFGVLGELNSFDFEVPGPGQTEGMMAAALAYAVLDYDSEDPWSAYLATTIPTQKHAIATLQRLGFKQLSTHKNDNTGNQVTLWQAIINR